MVSREVFSLKEAGEILGCHAETVRRAIKRGELRASKVGRDYRISRLELEKYWAGRGGGRLFEDEGGEDGRE